MFVDKDTKVLIQGITGKEGQKACKSMQDYGTKVVAGVRPGKGGEEVLGVPVFNTVKEALEAYPDITISCIYVPPFAAKGAVMEAVEAGVKKISLIVERIPIKDTCEFLQIASENNVKILGPSSLGCLKPGVGRIGNVGGNLVNEIYTPGNIGVISRSGGMTNEISWQIRKAGFGQSMVFHVGGDLLMGTTYRDLLEFFEKDEDTKVVVLFGEHGGKYEFEIVDLIREGGFTKPLIVYVGGKFSSMLPEGMNVGHAGAIVGRGMTAEDKERAFKEVSVNIADRYEDLVTIAKDLI